MTKRVDPKESLRPVEDAAEPIPRSWCSSIDPRDGPSAITAAQAAELHQQAQGREAGRARFGFGHTDSAEEQAIRREAHQRFIDSAQDAQAGDDTGTSATGSLPSDESTRSDPARMSSDAVAEDAAQRLQRIRQQRVENEQRLRREAQERMHQREEERRQANVKGDLPGNSTYGF